MFKTYFGNKKNIMILDFLGDHPRYEYTIKELTQHTHNYIVDNVKQLVKLGLIIKNDKNKKYKLNMEHIINQAVLKTDFEQGKIEADKLNDIVGKK